MNKEEVRQKIQGAMNGKQGDLLDILLSIPSPYFAFDGRPIAKDYPKAFKVLKEYLIDNSNGEINDLSDDDAVMAMFVNPRMLYDFFDSVNIYIGIVPQSGFSHEGFIGEVEYEKNHIVIDESKFSTRQETEKYMITKAFKYLDEK